MHPRLAELVDYAQIQRHQLFTALTMVPDVLRDRRTDPSTWSVGEVLEHLHLVESGIARLFTHRVQRARDTGAQPEREVGSLMSSLDAFRLTSRMSPMSAPDSVLPRGELTAIQVITALEQSRQDLLVAVRAGDGLALGKLTYTHPLLGTLNLYQWILFVGQHEARHAKQITHIGRQLAVEADNPDR